MANAPRNVDPSDKVEIGKRLRLIREWRALNQTQIAAMCSMSVQAWNNNECGRDRISIDPALRLARTTGISLDWIYWGSTTLLPASLLELIHRQRRPASSRPRRRVAR